MCCLPKALAKWMLFLINICVLISGILMLVIAVLTRYNNAMLQSWLKFVPTLPHALEALDAAVSEHSTPSQRAVLMSAFYVLIAVGIALTLVGFCGAIGAFSESLPLLLIYLAVMSIVLMLQVAAVALAFLYKTTALDIIQASLMLSIKYNYNGAQLDSNGDVTEAVTSIVSVAWDYAMLNLGCCGVRNYTDFVDYAELWNRSMVAGGFNAMAEVPVSCCKRNRPEELLMNMDNMTFVDSVKCTLLADEATTNHRGCFATIQELVLLYSVYIISALSVLFLIQFIGLASGCSLRHALREEKFLYHHPI